MVRLGIMGGGQLAQMMTQAAVSLGVETAIFERVPDSPAARLTPHQLAGDWADEHLLRQFAALCDCVTLESEFVDVAILRRLEALGLPVYPTPETLDLIQDKLVQKQTMQQAGIPVPPFRAVHTPQDVEQAAAALAYPLVLKARRDGYDGYGNATLQNPDDLPAVWARLGADRGRALLVEGWVPFVRELAVMVLRTRDGQMLPYPVVETIQQDHICHVVRAPAPVPQDVAQQAADIAMRAVDAVQGVGIFGVELFQLKDGSVLINEIAPRPHNSGHYSIEACVTSQFENHIRAVLGWPPGRTDLLAPAVVMVNVLGRRQGVARAEAACDALVVPGAQVHLYGKREVRPGRKMGHVTVLAASLEAAEAAARRAAELIEL